MKERELIESLARKAGETLMEHFHEDWALLKERGRAKEVATKYDKEVDSLIVAEIKRHYPRHSLLTEESGFLKDDPDWLWIVDSLDGTVDFANFNPFFSVCLALMHHGELILGAVYAPVINEFYFAEKGRGAYLNKVKIQVSDVSDLSQSYVFYCEGGERDRKRTGELLHKVYPRVTDIRKLGSAGLETAWVAAGKAEAYFTTRIEPWDVAPGVLLVEEAGGKVSDFRGNSWKPETSDMLFSNGKLHGKMLGLLSSQH
ncbi:MAG: inositol monophosphatase family protein [Dehalococcoidia bacterium]